MAQKLLLEYSVFTPKKSQLIEGLDGSKNMIVEGIVQRAEEFNHNGRRYPYEILKREVDKYIVGPIAENRALGELDHPESSIINLKNASHNIKDLWWDGNNLLGKIEILPTPSGNILRELFKNNITVGISSRGMGSVSQLGEGRVEVEEDFELLCWDFVSTPSTHGAFMKPLGLNENHTYKITNKYSKINVLVSDIICTQSGICCLR
jgi:hypothetical protein